MSGKLHHAASIQPESFSFTEENLAKVKKIIAKYPAGKQQSAVMPLLTLAQWQAGGWLPKPAMDHIAAMLGMPRSRVYEVASFYTMYNLAPVGTHVVEVCTTTPCWLMGSDDILEAAERRLGIRAGQTTPDGQFTLREAECLGACVNAPMCQVRNPNGAHYYEDLTPQIMRTVIEMLEQGTQPRPGPQSERKSSEPAEAK